MCGIAGVRRFGPEPITADQIKTLLVTLEHRGNDAAGVALQDASGATHVYKKNIPAWGLVTSDEYEGFIQEHLKEDTVIALVHTRAATKGSPSDARNNHPLWNGKSAVVHNGMLHNDDSLFSRLKLERIGAVDSDILRAIIDKHGMTKEGVKALKEISGSCAIAACDARYPGKLILGRSGSPLVFASTPDQLVWASEKQAIHNAMRPFEIRFGLPMCPNRTDLAWMTVNDNQIYLFGDPREVSTGDSADPWRYMDAIEWRDEFKCAYSYTAPRYTVHDNFFNRRHQRIKGIASSFAWCETCEEWISIPERLQNRPLYTLHCTACDNYLTPPPRGVKVKRRKVDLLAEQTA